MITRSCPICGNEIKIIKELIIVKKRFKADLEFYKELRYCNKCKWYRYSAR